MIESICSTILHVPYCIVNLRLTNIYRVLRRTNLTSTLLGPFIIERDLY